MRAMDGVIRPGVLGPLVGQQQETRVVSVAQNLNQSGPSLDGVRRLPTQRIVFPAAPVVAPMARPIRWRPALLVAAAIPMLAVSSLGGLRIVEHHWAWNPA